jgi:uncharacterized protein
MATQASAAPPVVGIHENVLGRHPLISFIIIAFAGTWLVELPLLLSKDGAGLLPFSSPLLIWTLPVGVYLGPFLAAFVVTGITEGRAYATCCVGLCCGGLGFGGTCSPSSASP